MSLRGLPPKTTDRIAGRTAPAGLRRMPCLTGPPRYRSSRLGTLGTAARCACFGGQTLAKSQVMAQVRKRRRQRVARSGHAGKNACGSCRRHGVRAAAVSVFLPLRRTLVVWLHGQRFQNIGQEIFDGQPPKPFDTFSIRSRIRP